MNVLYKVRNLSYLIVYERKKLITAFLDLILVEPLEHLVGRLLTGSFEKSNPHSPCTINLFLQFSTVG